MLDGTPPDTMIVQRHADASAKILQRKELCRECTKCSHSASDNGPTAKLAITCQRLITCTHLSSDKPQNGIDRARRVEFCSPLGPPPERTPEIASSPASPTLLRASPSAVSEVFPSVPKAWHIVVIPVPSLGFFKSGLNFRDLGFRALELGIKVLFCDTSK